MFLPVKVDVEKKLRRDGTLGMRMEEGTDFFSHGNFQRSNQIVFFKGSEHDIYPTTLFKCSLTKLTKVMTFRELVMHVNRTVDESSLHLFLGWFLELAEDYARLAGMNTVVVETKLRHITEWFVEHGWRFIESGSAEPERGFRGSVGYRGLKQLKEETT